MPRYLSLLFHPAVTRAREGNWGQGGTKKETLSQLWSLLLVALVPYKADGGPQSSPQQAPGNQDPQGFFLNDSQSGESRQPLPTPAPATPSDPSILPLLERGCLSHSMEGKDSSLGKGIEAFLHLPSPAGLCPLSQRGTVHWLLGAAFRAGY